VAASRGGLFCTWLIGCTLSNNSAGLWGGAIDARNGATVKGRNVSGNSASQGGGIADDIGPLTVDNSILSGNVATSGGGALYISNNGTATVENSNSITGNTAPLGSGPDVYNAGVL
jgi:hypothetical protein